MPDVFEPEKRRQLFLDFDLPFLPKFEPEKTGPFNRPLYLASSLRRFALAHLLGLRDRVLASSCQAAPPIDGGDEKNALRAPMRR